jgi:putative FmdB family regulatory protein
MPLYEFQCDECGHRFEIIQQKFSDPPPAACPKCGGPVQKLVSSPAFQFKGSGWYVTDYAKKSESQKPSDGPAESKDGAAKESKDSKDTSSKESKDTTSKDTSSAGTTSPPAAPSSTSSTTKSS